MSKLAKTRRLVLFLIVSLVVLNFPSAAIACLNCRYSPNGWGFCRPDNSWGGTDCKEVVVDSFSGRTDCDFAYGYDCRQGGTRITDGGTGDSGGTSGCWWTDLYGNCLI